MKTVVLISLIATLSFSGFKSVHGQSRKSVDLNENWIVTEAKPDLNVADFIPVDMQNPGNGWYAATMPKQVQEILFENRVIVFFPFYILDIGQ